jgi:hypothetical protein
MRRRILWVMGLLLAVGVGAWLVRSSTPPPANLIQRSTKIAAVQGLFSYSWLSSEEQLVKTDVLPLKALWSGHLDLIQAQTRTRTRLKALTATIMSHQSHYDYAGPWGLERSPDGQWLLWTRRDPRDGGTYPVTARLDGSGYHEWQVNAQASHFWLDSRQWISHVWSKRTDYLAIHDVLRQRPDRRLPYESPEAQALLKQAWKGDLFAVDDRKPLLYANPPRNSASGGVYPIIMRPANSPPGTQAVQIDTIAFPPGTQICNNIPNADRTRIEFVVRETYVPSYARITQRLIPSYRYPVRPIERLCIYRLDKKEFYEVGRVEGNTGPNPELIHIFWLPDGKHIQFLYKNAVYRVAIE